MSNKTRTSNIPDWLKKAQEKWEFNGEKRPPFAEVPKKGQRSVWDFPRPPALERVQKKVEVRHKGALVASTSEALAVLETASPPTYYFPPKDVKLQLLVKIPNRQSLCEWKGKAHYFALAENGQSPVAWSYPNPFSPYEELKDYLAFYPQNLECYFDKERVRPQPGAFYAGWISSDLAGPFKGEPGSGHW